MDNKKVIKRDERIQKYDWSKIEAAVGAAFKKVNQEMDDTFRNQLRKSVEAAFKLVDAVSVEDIQDIIQRELIKRNKYDAAEEFIIYRNKRTEIREQKSDLVKNVTKKLNGSNIENQNANLDEASFSGRIGEAGRVVCKNDALKYRMSKKSRKNHENNEIYIHDLDSYSSGMSNCLSIPFDDLLANGFKTKQTDVRPASSVNTAFQLVAVIMQLQSLQQFGGVAATHLDWTMVPYVRKSFWKHFKDGLKYIGGVEEADIAELSDDPKNVSITDSVYISEPMIFNYALNMTKKEIHQAVEGMYHNLNTLQSRSGGQLPFSSINYGTCTLDEGRMVIDALLDVSIEGLGTTGKTSIFPCGIFQYMKGVNDKPGTPNYDMYQKALRSTAQRLYPNYVNCDWSNNAGYDVNDPKTYMSSMGCRTVNLWDINGFGQLKDGRGNICPVTIIMPTLAMQCKDDKNPFQSFIKLLEKKIIEAKDMLIERFNYICSQSPESARFMYENNTMAGYVPEEGIRSALKHGTLAIGQLGLAETLQILMGCDHTTDEGMRAAKVIEALFAHKCAEFKDYYKLNFGVYYTPKNCWVA